jgi:3-oxoacyl-[acyl-carrier protein] reductase
MVAASSASEIQSPALERATTGCRSLERGLGKGKSHSEVPWRRSRSKMGDGEKMQNYLDLTGKVALVTGASSGIGAATAEVFADLGARVAIGYYRNQDGAEQVRGRIAAAGGTAIGLRADMRKAAEVRSLVERARSELGPIDILVNNAGSLVKRMAIRELTEEGLAEILDVNLKSAVLCAQAAAPSMIERRRGAIINVVSIAAHNGGGPGAGPYAASKAALIAFTKSQARELAPYGIRVNAISPGVIDTPFHEVFSTAEMMANFVKMIPLGRVGRAIECAKVIAFLASDAASFMVGETVEVNGGQLMV